MANDVLVPSATLHLFRRARLRVRLLLVVDQPALLAPEFEIFEKDLRSVDGLVLGDHGAAVLVEHALGRNAAVAEGVRVAVVPSARVNRRIEFVGREGLVLSFVPFVLLVVRLASR